MMRSTNGNLGFVLATCLAVTTASAGVTFADTAPEVASLRAELAELKSRLADLESRQDQGWVAQRQAQTIEELTHEVLADADQRASLLTAQPSAGHNGKNFYLASDDGYFGMVISGQFQGRFGATFRDGRSGDSGVTGFEIARARLTFAGHVADPRISYLMQVGADKMTGDLELIDAVVGFELADGRVKIEAGRQKLPFMRETLISSKYQLAVERSNVQGLFGAGRSEGLWVKTNPTDFMKVVVALSDGAKQGDVGVEDKSFSAQDTDLAITGRMDFKLIESSNWKQLEDFNSWSQEDMAIFMGAAAHFELAETGSGVVAMDTQANREADSTFAWTVDMSLEHRGLGAYVAGVGKHRQFRDDTAADEYGAIAQVSYMIVPDTLEPYFRYEYMVGDLGLGDVHILTLGANYYLRQHNAKFTVDIAWAPEPVRRGGSTSTGILPDSGNATTDQVALRAQFQLLF